MEFVELEMNSTVTIGDLEIKIVPVNHPVEAVGFVMRDTNSTVIISGDTGPTEKIWEEARAAAKDKESPLKAIITEVSFPNDMQFVADLAGHFTPKNFAEEVRDKFPKDIPIYLYHLKPMHFETVMEELHALDLDHKIEFLDIEDLLNFDLCDVQGKENVTVQAPKKPGKGKKGKRAA